MDRLAARWEGFGTTIFTEMSALAERTGAINLGQGFPDEDGPAAVVEAAAAAMRAGHNQYAPLPGVPVLREAIAAHQRRFWGMEVDPEAGVQVTFGATEAIAAALLGLLDPGDEVVCFEPYYDSYAAGIAMAGAVRRPVTLRPPDWRFDAAALEAAIGPRAPRAPPQHAPQSDRQGVHARGAGADRGRSAARTTSWRSATRSTSTSSTTASTCRSPRCPAWPSARSPSAAGQDLQLHRLEGRLGHRAPGLAAVRTAPVRHLRGRHPVPPRGRAALAMDDGYYAGFAAALRAKRDRLCAGLEAAGLRVYRPAGTYFVNADAGRDGAEFCRELAGRAGVVAIPTAVFYDDVEAGRTLVRFAFCKREAVIDEAASRLASMVGAPGS